MLPGLFLGIAKLTNTQDFQEMSIFDVLYD
jgi:hypothetical protein